jgi:hypothetical protein
MAEKILNIILILLPVSIILAFLVVHIFKVERKITHYLIIFLALFGTLILLYLIFII